MTGRRTSARGGHVNVYIGGWRAVVVGAVLVGGVLARPGVAGAQPGTKFVFQSTGTGGVNVNDSPGARIHIDQRQTTFVVQSTDMYLARTMLNAFERGQSDDRALAAQMQVLRRTLAGYDERRRAGDAAAGDELAALGEQVRAIQVSHAAFWELVGQHLQRLDDIETRLAALEAQRAPAPELELAAASAALDDGDLDGAVEAFNYIKFEQTLGQQRMRFHVGLASVGDGALADGGTAAYFRLTWPLVAYARRSFGIGLGGGGSFTIGAAELADDKRFVLDASAHVGPWLRLGGSTNLLIEAMFDPPLYLYAQGDSSFPLLGVGGRIALSHEPTSLGVFYRRAFASVLGDGPDITTAGVSIAYVDSSTGGHALRNLPKRTDAAWGGMVGILSHDTFPTGGLAAGARLRTHTTYYPNSRSFGVGATMALTAMLGQLDRGGDDKVFVTGAGFATGPHVRFGRSGWFKLEAHVAMELFGYADADWKFFLPGIGGEIALGWLSVIYRHVHASWRDDRLGDYNLLMLAFNKQVSVGSRD